MTVRELRNHGGRVLDRIIAGESLTITRDGEPVAELRPVARPARELRVIRLRWSDLPYVDPAQLRVDVDAVVDATL